MRAFAFSPDGERLAALSDDGAVVLWDPATGSPTAPSFGQGRAKESWRSQFKDALPSFRFLFSSDGSYLIWVCGKSVDVWNASSGAVVLARHDLEAAAASPDGSLLALGTREGVVLWDVAAGKPRGEPLKRGDLGDFSPDSRTLIVATAEGILLIPVSGGEPSRILFEDKSTARRWWRFSPDGRLVATPSRAGTATWRVEDGRPAGPVIDGGLMGLGPDQELLAREKDGGVGLWMVSSGERLALRVEAPFGSNTGDSWHLFSPKGRLLAMSAAQYAPWLVGRKSSPLEIWDLGAQPPQLLDRIERAVPIAFSPGGDILCYKLGGSGLGRGLGLWNVRQRDTVATLDGKCPTEDYPEVDLHFPSLRTRPTFSPDGAWVACGGWPSFKHISLWDASRFR